tara:strand:+ start:282 stop:713 length:432 start_codon:yes stop_codon:yes gene_type:complete
MGTYTFKKDSDGQFLRYRNGEPQDIVFNSEFQLLQKIEELEAENQELKNYIGYHLSGEQKERIKELDAHCETLRNDLKDAMEWNWLDDDAPDRISLDRTPAQSLAAIQREAIEEYGNHVCEAAVNGSPMLSPEQYAEQLTNNA